MITKIQNRYSIDSAGNKRVSADFYCLSTDALPETANNADKLYEMDTGIQRYFNAETCTWIPPRVSNETNTIASTDNFTIVSYSQKSNGVLYEIFADDVVGFDEFIELHGFHALPGSTVDIADLKTIFRLRNDGNWEARNNYASSLEEAAAIEEAAIESLLEEIIPDAAIEATGSGESEDDTE